MVKITFTPYQELVVHEIVEEENSAFFEDVVRQTLATSPQVEPSINWIDGIAFIIQAFAPTEAVVKENLNGRIHFAVVIFTRVPYQSQIQTKIGSQTFNVRLRKADVNPTLVDLAAFLKKFNRN